MLDNCSRQNRESQEPAVIYPTMSSNCQYSEPVNIHYYRGSLESEACQQGCRFSAARIICIGLRWGNARGSLGQFSNRDKLSRSNVGGSSSIEWKIISRQAQAF